MPLLELPGSSHDRTTQLVGRRAPYPHNAFTDASIRAAAAFVPRPSDVFIVTAPKTGTSWLQQVCHHLRRGDPACPMGFDDIYQVVPWDQMAGDLGQRLDEEQQMMAAAQEEEAAGGAVAAAHPNHQQPMMIRLHPRLFKSHQRLSGLSRGARYIATVREPAAALRSWHAFVQALRIPGVSDRYADDDGTSRFITRCHGFVRDGMRFGASLWEYYAEFHAALALSREDESVLVLVFEDLVADLRGHLPLIAAHMGVPCGAALADAVAAAGEKGFMAAHHGKFDGSWAYERLRELGMPADKLECNQPAPRVVNRAKGRPLQPEAAALLRTMWQERVRPETGCEDYDALAADVRAELRRRQAALKKL
jgi:aryl sulfotransferase